MRRWSWCILLLALAVRLATLGSEGLWYDEAFTRWLMSLSPLGIVDATAGDVHPPAYYLMLRAVTAVLGDGEIALRLPSAILSSLAAVEASWLAADLMRELLNTPAGAPYPQQARTAGYAAGLLFALLPAFVYYGQEARMYALLIWLVLLAARAVLNRRWSRLWPALGLMAYTHNYGLLYAAGLALWALSRGRREVVPGLTAAGIAWLPWFAVLAGQLGAVSGGYWIPPQNSPGAFLYYLPYSTFFVRVPGRWQLHAALAAYGLTIAALYVNRRHMRRLWPVLVLAFGVPFAVWIVSAVWRPVMLDRALVPAGALAVVLWALMFGSLPRRQLAPAALVLVPMLAASLYGYHDPNGNNRRDDTIGFAEIINGNWQSGDCLYHTTIASLVTLHPYVDGAPGYVWPHTGELDRALSERTEQALGINALEVPADELACRRIWSVRVENAMLTENERQAQRELAAGRELIREWRVAEDEWSIVDIVLLTGEG